MIIKDRRKDFLSYLEDTSNIKGEASLLYIPQNKEEVSLIVKECVSKKFPFTVSSGRTGTTGGCVAQKGAIISLENLNKIIDVDSESGVIHLEAGVSLEELENQASKLQLTLRASPTESLAFVGGAIATSASGVRGFGYGSIRRYVKSIEVILPQGDTVTINRGQFFSKKRLFDFSIRNRVFKFLLPSYTMPKVKSQAGYFVKDNMDLIDLFIGNEGTLGIIVSCQLQLQKMPFNIFDGLVFFNKEIQALDFVAKIIDLKKAGFLRPASLEFFDSNSLEMLKPEYSFIPDCEAAVYFEQEAENEADYNHLMDKWASLIEEAGASLDKSILADTPQERKKVFDFRHKLPQMINEFLKHNNRIKASSDIAVPWHNLEDLYNFYKEKGNESGLNYVNFGHIGEAHLHFNFLPKNDKESIRAKKYLEIFCQKAVSLGGTVSAEHGIGKIKKPYLKIMYTEKEIKEMAALKKYFDPNCLLGLDNIFEKEFLTK